MSFASRRQAGDYQQAAPRHVAVPFAGFGAAGDIDVSGNIPLQNPCAPPALVGIVQNPPTAECTDVDATMVFDIVMTASQVALEQSLGIGMDADFVWQSIAWTSSAGIFGVRFSDELNQAISNTFVYCENIPGKDSFPTPVFPAIRYPAGFSMKLDLINLAASGNTIQLRLRGIKRYTK